MEKMTVRELERVATQTAETLVQKLDALNALNEKQARGGSEPISSPKQMMPRLTRSVAALLARSCVIVR